MTGFILRSLRVLNNSERFMSAWEKRSSDILAILIHGVLNRRAWIPRIRPTSPSPDGSIYNFSLPERTVEISLFLSTIPNQNLCNVGFWSQNLGCPEFLHALAHWIYQSTWAPVEAYSTSLTKNSILVTVRKIW